MTAETQARTTRPTRDVCDAVGLHTAPTTNPSATNMVRDRRASGSAAVDVDSWRAACATSGKVSIPNTESAPPSSAGAMVRVMRARANCRTPAQTNSEAVTMGSDSLMLRMVPCPVTQLICATNSPQYSRMTANSPDLSCNRT